MKKLLIGLGIVVLLIVAAAIAAPFLVPVDTYKGRLVAAVKEATGRDLRIDGPVRLSILPSLAVEARDVSFANAPGGSAKDMATLKALDVQLRLWPLLRGAVEVDKFVLNEPVIALEVAKDGQPNWRFARAGAEAKQAAPAPSAPAPARPGGGRGLSALRLDDVRLVDGRVTYLDQRTGKKQALSAVDMKLSLPSLDGPFAGSGSAVWNGERIALDATVAKPRAIEAGESTPLALRIESKPVAFDFKGEAGGAGTRLAGAIDLNVPSVRGLLKWAGAAADLPGGGFGPLAIKGKVEMAGDRLSFSDADLSLDAIKAKGQLALATGGARPYAKGRLDVEMLDVNPYLPAEASAGAKPTAANAPAPAAPAGPGHPQPAASPGWSDQPLDLAPLKLADADFDLSAGGIKYRKLTLGKSVLALHLKDGRLVADLSQLALYQGSGQAKLTVDGGGAVPGIDADVKLAGIEAEPLLRDLDEIDRLKGKGDFSLAVTGRGKSQREIVSALDGKGALAFKDGAIKGVNLGEIVRNPAGALAGNATAQQTDFSELSGTFTIANGILKNSDLALKAPLLRLDGAGTVDLPNRTVDYRLVPKLAATSEGQGGRTDVGGVTVPVLVRGPWDHLSYEPDLAGVQVKGKLLDALKQPGGSGGGQPSGKPADILKGLLGGKR